jgi:hypothetical protein
MTSIYSDNGLNTRVPNTTCEHTFILLALMQILTFIILKVFSELFFIFMFHFASESINKYQILCDFILK